MINIIVLYFIIMCIIFFSTLHCYCFWRKLLCKIRSHVVGIQTEKIWRRKYISKVIVSSSLFTADAGNTSHSSTIHIPSFPAKFRWLFSLDIAHRNNKLHSSLKTIEVVSHIGIQTTTLPNTNCTEKINKHGVVSITSFKRNSAPRRTASHYLRLCEYIINIS